MTDLNFARSFLFVPGDRPERFAKAAQSGAHAMIMDLEDAVADAAKAEARRNIRAYLDESHPQNILVRINNAENRGFAADLDVAQHEGLAGVILPKANHAQVADLARHLSRPVWPLIETAQGVSEAAAIAGLPNCGRMLLGTIDLSQEMGLDMEHPGGQAMLDHARYQLVSAACRAGRPAPIDGVFPSLEDAQGLKAAAKHAAAIGMSGMMCIHPRQIEAIHAAFFPTDTEIEWAGAVLAASQTEKSSFRFRGQMVDKPVLARATTILSRLPDDGGDPRPEADLHVKLRLDQTKGRKR
ncbi:HpcH/HpaI aldolase/citrate lyase family protein [Leisingera thetidis]|uniref:HpcH/HpaI aldolase/citrate lyase family protein n=1 Tax=Leisingera thetidis TaxID=2930199 RepID=UPI0021F7F7FA|nr:CoA ester lyase [Leisingera thetidis]